MPIYTDIDLSFSIHPSTGDLLKKFDEVAAKYWLRHLLMTTQGELVDNPYYGVGINSLLFETLHPALVGAVKRDFNQQVTAYLPEINVISFDIIDGGTNELIINLVYYVVGNPQSLTYNLVLTRGR